ncbi:amidohydrolase, partial [Mycolicibacterium chitae]|nr:amidohydrolase [Mycolicibacterium chitae]
FDTYDVTDEEINKITHENAMKLYQFEPFNHIPKDQATVGALRKSVEGHDVEIRALSHERDRSNGGSGMDALTAAAHANSSAR